MAIIKSYTDISQSKKLAEILPLESADMYFDRYGDPYFINVSVTHERIKNDRYQHLIPCWSLAALLDILPDELEDNHYLTLDKEGKEYCCSYEDCNGNSFRHTFADNPVDACYEMILKLHELKML